MDITDAMIKKSCSATMYKRGMEYFREGRVHLRKRGDNFINAVVDGDEIYNVQVKFDKNGITGCMCTCPYFQTMNSVCKHIVAAMKQRQTEIEEGGSYVDENDQLAVDTLQKIYDEVWGEGVYKCVGVKSEQVVYGGGNIHCITQQEPSAQTK